MQQLETGVYFKLITDKLRAKADADLKSHGLTMTQSRVLCFLSDHDGEATQKEIIRRQDEKLFASLSEKQVKELTFLLQTIYENLNTEEEDTPC